MFLSDGEPNDTPAQYMSSLKQLIIEVPNVIMMVYGLDIDNEHLRDMAGLQFTKHAVVNPSPLPTAGEFESINPQNIRIKLGTFYSSFEHWKL